jgi:hypothetical protein
VLVDDTENVHSRDGASILCGLCLLESLTWKKVGTVTTALLTVFLEVSFSSFLHLEEDYRRYFFAGDLRWKKSTRLGAKDETTYKIFLIVSIFNTDIGFVCLAEYLESEVLEIRLNLGIVELATNKVFCIEDTRKSLSLTKSKVELSAEQMVSFLESYSQLLALPRNCHRST